MFIDLKDLKNTEKLENYSNYSVEIIKAKYNNKDVILKKSLLEDYDLFNEVQALKNISNQYIVNYYGCTIENNKIYNIVIEYINGKPLNDFLDDNEDLLLNYEWINEILLQITKGIKCIHDNNFYHNDIKSANIMIYEKNKIKLIDFGSCGSKKLQCFSGTYNAPEKYEEIYNNLYNKYVKNLRIKKHDDFYPVFYDKNDIFSLGFVIWEIFHYPKYPFEDIYPMEDENRIEKINKGIKENILKEILKDNIPNIYKYIINSCWEYDMFERISVNDIIKKIESI